MYDYDVKNKRILGLWSGHDCSFAILNDGIVEQHTELERHTRIKEDAGDSIQLFYDQFGETDGLISLATCYQPSGIQAHAWSWKTLSGLGLPLHVCGHHQSHAAHAFYSSRFDEAAVVTIDGGGIENAAGFTASVSMWHGKGTKLEHVAYIPAHQINLGAVWSRLTKYVFGCESGWPFGHQAGTVMALAALGKSDRWLADFREFFGSSFHLVDPHPVGHKRGMSARDPNLPKHPYLERWASFARNDEQAKFDMALALQTATEEKIFEIVEHALRNTRAPAVCLSGGVALNSVAMGKLLDRFEGVQFYVPPVPYDGGLTIGAAQHLWHHVMGNDRIEWKSSASPYLGKLYSRNDVFDAISKALAPSHDSLSRRWSMSHATDEIIIDDLLAGKIVSIFSGRAESGRRALGNRSIIADPRDPKMKDRVNERCKHRSRLRPFAPSIARESVGELFERSVESPYMSFVVKFKPGAASALPAVVHFDGTARLQTVSADDAPWYHAFLKKWEVSSGYPVLLNTSFNDREPIVEEPIDAIKCFAKTDIDVLYFPEHGLTLRKTGT